MSETNNKPSDLIRVSECGMTCYTQEYLTTLVDGILNYLDEQAEQHEREVNPPCTHCIEDSRHPDCTHTLNPDRGKNYCHLCSSYLSWEEVEEVKKRAVKHVDSKECDHQYTQNYVFSKYSNAGNPLKGIKCGNEISQLENVSGEVERLEEFKKSLDDADRKVKEYMEWLDKHHPISKRPAKDVKQELSKCCNWPAKVVGSVTMNYVCTKCGYPCDIGGVERKELVELDENVIEKLLYKKDLEVGSDLSYTAIAHIICSTFGVPRKLSVEEMIDAHQEGGFKLLHQRIYGQDESKEGQDEQYIS